MTTVKGKVTVTFSINQEDIMRDVRMYIESAEFEMRDSVSETIQLIIEKINISDYITIN